MSKFNSLVFDSQLLAASTLTQSSFVKQSLRTQEIKSAGSSHKMSWQHLFLYQCFKCVRLRGDMSTCEDAVGCCWSEGNCRVLDVSLIGEECDGIFGFVSWLCVL